MNRVSYFEDSRARCLNEHYPHQSDDLYLIMCGLENCSPDKEVWDHVRIGYHLHVIMSGEGVIQVGDRRQSLHAGQLFLIKPGEQMMYRPRPENPWTYCWMTFDGARASSYIEEAGFTMGINSLNSHVDISRFYHKCDQVMGIPQLNMAAALRRLGLTMEFISLAVESYDISMRDVRGRHKALYNQADYVNHGSMIRKDWLDDLNLDIPTTFDELHDVLTAFKNEKGADMAMMRANTILYLSNESSFVGGYDNLTASGTGNVPWVIGDDGKVICSYLKPSFQGYVQLLADWYKEGLFSEDAFAQDPNPTEWFPYIYQNRCGYWTGTTTGLTNTFRGTVDDPNCEIVPMADVTLVKGATIESGNSRGILGDGGWAVTTQCDQVEDVCRYMDWFFTDEGYEITNYGTQGVTYTVGADGVIQYTDLIVANPNGWSAQACFAIYCQYMQNPSDRSMWSKAATLDESARSCFEVWTANRSEARVCQGALTAAETEIYNAKVGDMATYAFERLLGMVHGDFDVASEWPGFVAQLESMGIGELTALKQAAYDRYMAR